MEFDISAESGTADYYRKLSQNLSNYRSVLKAYSAFLESDKVEAYHAVAVQVVAGCSTGHVGYYGSRGSKAICGRDIH